MTKKVSPKFLINKSYSGNFLKFKKHADKEFLKSYATLDNIHGIVVSTAKDMAYIKEYISIHAELHLRIESRLNMLEASA